MMNLQFPSEYIDERHKDTLSRSKAFYTKNIGPTQSLWQEADLDSRFECGDQALYGEYWNMPIGNRKNFYFNRIRKITNLITGFQIRNRKSLITVPIENASNQTADQFTKLFMSIDRREGFSETLSRAFHSTTISGLSLLRIWVDYRSDPISGDIKWDFLPYNCFMIDTFARKPDLSDCNGIMVDSYLTREEVISLLPHHKEELEKMSAGAHTDGKFYLMPENFNTQPYNLFSYREYFYKDFRRQKLLLNPENGSTLEWKGTKEDLDIFLASNPNIILQDQQIPTVRQAIIVQGRVLEDGPNFLGIDSYPFVLVPAYWSPHLAYWPLRCQSVVRSLRDAQYLYNRQTTLMLDILESQLSSGYIYKENALVNPRDIFMTGQGKGIALKDSAVITDIQKIPPAMIPPTTIEIQRMLGDEILLDSGANEELMGSATDEKAGILAMLRQGAGLTTLQILFDNLDYAMKLAGRIQLEVIQANFTPGKVERMIHEQPTDEFYNRLFGKYDCAVEEGYNTTTQRQMQLGQLLHFKEIGMPIPDSVLIEAATLQNKDQLLKTIQQQQQQQQQAEQQQAQMAMAQQKAQMDVLNATADAQHSMGIERLSRVQENQSLAEERKAAAKKDEDIGLLNLVKALKELEGIDITHLKELITMAKVMESQQQASQTTTPAADIGQLENIMAQSKKTSEVAQQPQQEQPQL